MWRKCKLHGPPLLLIYHVVSLYIDVPMFSGVFPFLIVIYLQFLCLFTSFGFAVSICPLAKMWVIFNHTLVTVSPPFLHPSQGMVFQNTVDLVKKNNLKSVFPPQAHRHLFGTCVSIHFWIPYDSNHLQLAFYKLFNSPQVFIFHFVSKLNWGHWVTETDICTCDRAQICPCSGIQLENTRIEAGGLFFSRSFLKTFLSHLLEAACGSCGKAAQ